MIAITKSLGLRGSAVIDKQDEINIEYGSQGFGDAFSILTAYCNKMIYRGIGLPSLIADNTEVGSQALGKEHFKLFFLTLEHLCFEVIDVLIEQLVKSLIIMNHGEQDNYGTFVLDNFQVEDGRVLAETFNLLAQAGLVDAQSLPDVNTWRERLGLELWTEEDLKPSAPPAITGLDPETEPQTEESTDPGTDEPIEAPSKKTYSYSLAERRRNTRRLRMQRWSTPSDVDKVAEQLAQVVASSRQSHGLDRDT